MSIKSKATPVYRTNTRPMDIPGRRPEISPTNNAQPAGHSHSSFFKPLHIPSLHPHLPTFVVSHAHSDGSLSTLDTTPESVSSSPRHNPTVLASHAHSTGSINTLDTTPESVSSPPRHILFPTHISAHLPREIMSHFRFILLENHPSSAPTSPHDSTPGSPSSSLQSGGHLPVSSTPHFPGISLLLRPQGASLPSSNLSTPTPGSPCSTRSNISSPLSASLYSEQSPLLERSSSSHSDLQGPSQVTPREHHYVAPKPFKKQGIATVWPAEFFNPVADAHALHKAMIGFGTDTKTIIKILAFRSNQQRHEIIKSYSSELNRCLLYDLKSETYGEFEDLVSCMLMPPAAYDAFCLYNAIHENGTNKRVINGILASRTNDEMKEIRSVFEQTYGKTLESHVTSLESGDYGRLLSHLCVYDRDEGPANVQQAITDARELYDAGEGEKGMKEISFEHILTRRSFPHLRAVCRAYDKLFGHDMLSVVDFVFKSDLSIAKLYLAIIQCAISKASFFALRLHNALKKVSEDKAAVTRIILSRSEIDLGNIKRAFKLMHSKTLGESIQIHAMGNQKKLLAALAGEPF